MATFRDSNGKEWVVCLDAPTIRAVRQECKLDLADLEGKAYGRMVDDPVLLVDVLWIICRRQAQEAGVTDEQFGRALIGDAIERATAAMLESIADFFPRDQRELLLATAAANAKIRHTGISRAMAKINDPDLESQIVAALEQRMSDEIRDVLQQLTRSSSATVSPASAVSIPAD